MSTHAHRHTTHEHEHDFEAVRGLPEPLPPGETLLWQGAPDWRVLARHGLHLRQLVGYFGVILALRFATMWGQEQSVWGALRATAWLLPLAALAIGMAALMAWMVGRTALYTLTDRRIVMRVGIVLTLTFNIPLRRVESAALHALKGGRDDGDIALSLDPSTHIAYVHLWPYVRPWKLARTQPMLRALHDASHVGRLIGDAWAAEQARHAPLAAQADVEAVSTTPAAAAGSAPATAPTSAPTSAPSAVPARARLAAAAR